MILESAYPNKWTLEPMPPEATDTERLALCQAQRDNLQAINADLLDALKLIVSLPGFEPDEQYAAQALAAIAKAECKP